ncbi:universal stress protein [Nocardia tengchongensis]|uniref:Universal stress protein n=1 Tax=Nocardia tengchongensis TaxID=2055889 RepID=A0ABX8CU33_9NOCA|nr:universal stress protein [Nocardia tengchongensis]QVI23421.1 universal stress protein [Nocardia tengchongensis]
MSTGESVIVAVDESAGSAVAWAAHTAALHHAPLHLLRVLEITPDEGLGLGTAITTQDYSHLEEHGNWVLETAATAAAKAAPGLTITTELATGAVVPTLLERTRQARMLVGGARGGGTLRRALLGSVSSVLARRAHCPFVVVRDGVPFPVDLPTRPILVGVDGTKISEPAIRAALEEASVRGVAVIALHAEGASDDPEMDALDDYVLAESLAGWQERYPNVRIDRETAHDTPERSLLALSSGSQLLVVGTRGRGGFAGKVFGSTSQSLLLRVQTPIMIAHTA